MESVSCEDLEKMSAKNVRDLKRARQFALPKIAKLHSPRDFSSSDTFPPLVRPAHQKYLSIGAERPSKAEIKSTYGPFPKTDLHKKMETEKRSSQTTSKPPELLAYNQTNYQQLHIHDNISI